jgi:hypothetical protein
METKTREENILTALETSEDLISQLKDLNDDILRARLDS